MKKIRLILSVSILLVAGSQTYTIDNFALSTLNNIKKFTHTYFIKPFDSSLKKILKTSKVDIYDENNEFKGEIVGVKNLKVLSQNGASCGYNALRNGVLIAQGRLKELQDKNIATDLYGTDTYNALMGFWRRAVITKRTGILQKEGVTNKEGITNIDDALEKYNKRCREKGYNTIDLTGEWLDDGELEMLIKYERNDGCLLSDNKLPITIIEDVSIFDVPEQGEMTDEEYQSALQTRKEVTSVYGFDDIKEKCKDSTYKHVFIIGTMQRDQKTGSSGAAHWFTLVVRNGKCYVADSLGYDRSEDSRVEKILELVGRSKIDNFEQLANIEQDIDNLVTKLNNTTDEDAQDILQVNISELKEKYQRLRGKKSW